LLTRAGSGTEFEVELLPPGMAAGLAADGEADMIEMISVAEEQSATDAA
jgi:hypothetical protein